MQKNKAPKAFHHSTFNFRVMVIITAIVFVMAAVLITANSRASKVTNPSSVGADTARFDELNIELTDNGFVPTEITHSSGAFGISVENTSSANEYTLRLKAADGTILNEIPVQKGSVAWSVNLQPGLYTLTETNHEQWSCVITVQ